MIVYNEYDEGAEIHLTSKEVEIFRIILNRTTGSSNRKAAELAVLLNRALLPIPKSKKAQYKQLTLEEGIEAQLRENENKNSSQQESHSYTGEFGGQS